ncbi:MAG: hypothetical protein WCL53_08680 [Chloroflexota bacterium]
MSTFEKCWLAADLIVLGLAGALFVFDEAAWSIATAVGTIGATLAAMTAIIQARAHHADDVRSQIRPLVTVDEVDLVPDGIVLSVRNVGVGPAIDARVDLWVEYDDGEEVSNSTITRERVENSVGAPQLSKVIPNLGPNDLRNDIFLPFEHGAVRGESGWVRWSASYLNAFGENARPTSAVIPTNNGQRTTTMLGALEITGIAYRHDLITEPDGTEVLALSVGPVLTNRIDAPVQYVMRKLEPEIEGQRVPFDLDDPEAFSSTGGVVYPNQATQFFSPTFRIRTASWPIVLTVDMTVHARRAGDRAITVEVVRKATITLSHPVAPPDGSHTQMALGTNWIGLPSSRLVSDEMDWNSTRAEPTKEPNAAALDSGV